MTTRRAVQRSRTIGSIGILVAVGVWSLVSAGSAEAASVLSGPINLGTSSTYGVLAASAITNTGPTVVTGDLGVSPQSSITGFTGLPNGTNIGVVHDNDAPALMAQNDLTTAFNSAAGLTPISSGLSQLNGMSLTPGVYSGGALALSNNGTLTLAGVDANSIWVFQAASSLTIGSATHIVITGGASACNVFWEVGSSASIGTSANFQGTVLAAQSVTAATGATVTGRLLARGAAVTLDSNTINVPLNCTPGTTPTTTGSPALTAGTPPTARVGTPYSFAVSASGAPAPTFTVTSGNLPAGLALNSATGIISGTPTTVGSSTFTVTATNGVGVDVSSIITITAARPVLALTGVNVLPELLVAFLLLFSGAAFTVARRLNQISITRSHS
jgi:Ice-binding-like/Putative Ig domain